MKFSVASLIAVAVGASAYSNVTVTTEVVDVYTTYCPEATQITHGTKTYTVTAPTTLTISECPCTITRPVTVVSSVVCHNCPKPTGAPPAPAPTSNGTVPVNPTPSAIPPTAGAAKAVPALAGLVGLFAALL
ncbi:clock-controlled protein 6 [Cordyceps militaris CM01]|uniref:Clock-controlled protein 6 n=2 Tax=Cordyceps militaris TaxID=73501 RepID=G3JC11_CORMM|nr:clock-controlled protein 6 [Cordyceps militaris CM01]ATY60566.1 clock-controlled 6 [Cordyceps militaris]EGX93729.1 clock-controlled protein 6 [Cordyceps militaris CM01]